MTKWISTRNELPFKQDTPSNRDKAEFVIVAYMLPEDIVNVGRIYFSIGIFTHEGWGIQGSIKDRYTVLFWRPMNDILEDLYQLFDKRGQEEGFNVEYIKENKKGDK